MTENDEHALLADLDADDWNTARDAVEVAGHALRTRAISSRQKAEISARFLRLASHPKWEIRKAIAHAMLFLQHDNFLATIGSLVDDENAWVQEAARKTLRRRESLTRADIGGAAQGDVTLDLLSSLEARYGLRARRAASKVADHLHYRFVREAYHEISKIIAPLDASLLNLANDLDATVGVSDSALQSCRRAQGRVRLIIEFLDNLRAFTTDEPSVFAPESLRPIIEEAVELAAGQDAGAGIYTLLEVDDALQLEASRSHLLQAFINVITNAVEACAGLTHQGVITISAHLLHNTHIRISIIDNGRGMGTEAVKDCFLLYSSGKAGGMGFGLPLAKKIIEINHRGSLSIESEKGAGATVTIILPVVQLQAED